MKKDINQTDTTEIIRVVSEDFEKLGMQALPARPDMHSLEGLKKLLADRIAKMFDTNYEKLLNALYLIDLDETRLHKLFAGKNREFIPTALAEMIIERQMEKIMWRKKHREGKL